MTNERTILVTGGCGFVGANLVEYLLENTSYDIKILDNLSSGSINYVQDITDNFSDVKLVLPTQLLNNLTKTGNKRFVSVVEGDIRNENDVEKAIAGANAVVHLAAMTGVPISIEKPKETFQVNVSGTQNLLESCRKLDVGEFVLASSNAAVGEKEPPIHEEMVPKPITPYGASKLAGEALCRSYADSFDISANALRFANVYGPHSDHKSSVVMKFARNALVGKPLNINGDGEQTRDFIHASDIAEGINRTLESGFSGEVFHIGTGKAITINELAADIQDIAEEYGYSRTEIEHSDPRPGDIYQNYSDPSKAEEKLSFSASVEFESGLEMLMGKLMG